MKVNRIIEEDIARRIMVLDNGKRKVHSKKLFAEKNPEKMIVDRFGDLEIFCYPYSEGNRMFLSVKGRKVAININDLIRFFWRNASLLRRIRKYNRSGVRNKNGSASKWWDCYLAGMEATKRRTEVAKTYIYNTTGKHTHEELIRSEYIPSRNNKKAYKRKH